MEFAKFVTIATTLASFLILITYHLIEYNTVLEQTSVHVILLNKEKLSDEELVEEQKRHLNEKNLSVSYVKIEQKISKSKENPVHGPFFDRRKIKPTEISAEIIENFNQKLVTATTELPETTVPSTQVTTTTTKSTPSILTTTKNSNNQKTVDPYIQTEKSKTNKNADVGEFLLNMRQQADIENGLPPVNLTNHESIAGNFDHTKYKFFTTNPPETVDMVTETSQFEKYRLNLTYPNFEIASQNIKKFINKDYGNCSSLLHLGHWRSPLFKDGNKGDINNYVTYSNHTACAESRSCRANAWVVENCKAHRYTSSDARKCFQNRKMLFIGDSRGRQIFRAMENRLENSRFLTDEVEHHDIFRNLDRTVKIRWLWITKITDHFNTAGILEQLFLDLLRLKDPKKLPALIVFNSLLLHPTRACYSIELCNKNYKGFRYVVEYKLLPMFKEFIKKDVMIVWLASEDLDNRHKFSDNQISVLRDQNKWIYKLFENKFTLKERRLINFISATSRTVYTDIDKTTNLPMGDILLADGTHKLDRHVNTTIPTSLWADTNLILNFACNDRMRFEGVTCCVGG